MVSLMTVHDLSKGNDFFDFFDENMLLRSIGGKVFNSVYQDLPFYGHWKRCVLLSLVEYLVEDLIHVSLTTEDVWQCLILTW